MLLHSLFDYAYHLDCLKSQIFPNYTLKSFFSPPSPQYSFQSTSQGMKRITNFSLRGQSVFNLLCHLKIPREGKHNF